MKQFGLFLLAFILVFVLTPFVITFGVMTRVLKGLPIKEYLEISAIGFDQAGGSVMYGKENYTISSYTHYLCKYECTKCWFEKFIDFFFGREHCKNSFEWEIKKDRLDLSNIEKDYDE